MLELGSGLVADMGGETIGSVLWWSCGEDFATLGQFVIARPFRGGGIGRLLLESALDQIGDRSILLHATESGLPLLRKLGFRGISEVMQQQGTSFTAPLVPLEPGERIRPMGRNDLARATDLAQAATGLARPALMASLFSNGHAVVIDRGGEITGFAFFRRFGRGYVIGPVVAETVQHARALIAQWLGTRSGEFIRLDLPGECKLHDWLEELGLIRVESFVMMVRGEEPAPRLPGQSFAIAGQALF